MITPPRSKECYADRRIDCQEAMETAFQDMVEEMKLVGWSAREIRVAVRALVAADERTEEANAMTEAQIALARAAEQARRP